MVSRDLLTLVRCPLCEGRLTPVLSAGSFAVSCEDGHSFAAGEGYLDLWTEAPGRTSKYESPDFLVDPAYRQVGPPLLGAGVRLWMLKRLLDPRPGEAVLDVGCGNGKFAVWLRKCGVRAVGVDAAPHFAFEAIERVDLLRADARRLPLASGAFQAAYSIDVLEHLDRPSIGPFLSEINRILAPGGRLLLYSNTRERSTLRPLMTPIQAVHRTLVWAGLVDDSWDRRRKEDHVKALATMEDVVGALAGAGFAVERIVYWNTLFTGLLENVVVKSIRRIVQGSRVPRSVGGAAAEVRLAPVLARRRRYYWPLWALTQLTKLDIVLFGHLRAGPFFLLATKVGD